MSQTRKKPTIKDVEKLARVSPTAVSMALGNSSRIGQETRKRVLHAARKLNYEPNFVARSLVIKRSHTIGLIITSILNPFYPELAKGIEDKALELGYNIVLCSTNYDPKLESYYIAILRSKGVDGIIFSSVDANDPNIKPLIRDHFPFILINRRILNPSFGRKIDYIVVDNSLGGYMAMGHLYKLGHRRIGIIAGNLKVSTAIERTEGAKKFLRNHGLKLGPNEIIECNFSKDLAYHATRKFLSRNLRPTAIFAENDYMALGCREAILEAGLKIPEDIALVGFDDIAATALKDVELTTVSQKKYEMGSLAVKILTDKIEKRIPAMVNQVTLEPEMIIRRSCGYWLQDFRSEGTPKTKHFVRHSFAG